MDIKFAFAVDTDDLFQKKHFGDAEKYLIYQLRESRMIFEQEILNDFKTLDQEAEHGSKKKGKAIIAALKQKDVQVLVSRQFGKNINLINAHFIPIVTSEDPLERVIGIIINQTKKIQEELTDKSEKYSGFTIRHGIMRPLGKK